jgi:hypothetical protein
VKSSGLRNPEPIALFPVNPVPVGHTGQRSWQMDDASTRILDIVITGFNPYGLRQKLGMILSSEQQISR